MDGGSGLLQLRPHWWGILGAIGWAYLVAASLYLLLGDRPALLLGGVAALQGLYFLDQLGGPGPILAVRPWLGVGGMLGTHGGIALAGVVLGVAIASRPHASESVFPLAARGLALGAGLVAAGLLLHGLGPQAAFAFSKERATPPWGLVSAGLTALAWVVFFLAADGAGWRRWPRVVRETGENALLTYLLEPLVLALLAASAGVFGRNPWSLLAGESTAAGLASGALFAWLLGRLAGLLAGAGVRLRL
jgi:predicted acyltransferase